MPILLHEPVIDHGTAVPLAPEPGPADIPTLNRDELHVWVVGMQDIGDARKAQSLSAAETQRALRYRADFDRACFIQRRAALRRILAGYLGMAPDNVAYTVNEFGKPSVVAPLGYEGLAFNTSHSGSVAMIAVGRCGRIGIDVERLRPAIEDEAIANRFFAPNEVASLAALRPHDRVAGFFNAWTRKEAVVKALGGGLSIPLDSFDVSLQPDKPPAILRWDIPGAPPGQWRLHHLQPAAGYVGALAVDSATCIRCWRWAN